MNRNFILLLSVKDVRRKADSKDFTANCMEELSGFVHLVSQIEIDIKHIGSLLKNFTQCVPRKNINVRYVVNTSQNQKGPRGYIGLLVDHCHDSKAIRGLLCHNCNTILGASKDNPNILAEAIKYLHGTASNLI